MDRIGRSGHGDGRAGLIDGIMMVGMAGRAMTIMVRVVTPPMTLMVPMVRGGFGRKIRLGKAAIRGGIGL
ncbi:hypothetical protein [Paramagnetospirillum kuznetsovii]|nr:hypothetical protein [Paramagnetospirillum kuznetsovii]